MLKEALTYIMNLKKPEQIDVDGKIYFDKSYVPARDHYPDHLEINNLNGIVDFIESKPEEWQDMFIHVRDFNKVILYQAKTGDFNQRIPIIIASSRPCQFHFGNKMSVEDFIISLNGMFEKTEDRDHTLKFISSIKVDANAVLNDDGISQTITAKQGVSSLIDKIPIKNLVDLQPFRTFNEIDQPISQFVFRMQLQNEKPLCALYESDGEDWKQEAIQEISAFLGEALKRLSKEIPIIA
jgi:hypothetical protein